MADDKRVVKVGVRDLEIAQLDETEKVVGEITAVPGLISAKMNITSNQEAFYADDQVYAILNGGISELGLDINIADINTKIKQLLMGVKVEDGMELYTSDLDIPAVALVFRSKLNTGDSVWFGFCKGRFGLPSYDLNTKEGNASAQTDTINGQFEARNDRLMYVIGREDNEEFDVKKFRAKVFGTAAEPETETKKVSK